MIKSIKSVLVLGLTATALTGCAIKQDVNPVSLTSMGETPQMCVVNNAAVNKEGFEPTLISALEQKGFAVRVVSPEEAMPQTCPTRTTYSANWAWDLAVYMRRADIIVYEGTQIAGRATYDSSAGGMNMGKFISAEEKILELVNELFPTL